MALKGKKIMVVCSDPGASQAVLMLHRKLKRRSHRPIVVARHSGRKIARQFNIEREENGEAYGSYGRIKRYLLKENPSFLITGTSLRDNIERDYIKAARQLDVPTLSVVDWWTNFKKRFVHSTSKELRIPDFIWVMDKGMKKRCPKDIYRKAKIIVGGNPYLSQISKHVKSRKAKRRIVLKALGLDPSRKTILYFAEPLYKGYNQFKIFEKICEAISEALSEKKVNIIVKFHPNGQKRKIYKRYGSIANRRLHPAVCAKRFVINKHSASELIEISDYVWGMNTTPMLEAMLKERLVSSFLPDFDVPGVPFLKNADFCPSTNRFSQFRPLIKRLLTDDQFVRMARKRQRGFRMPKGDFTEKILSIIESKDRVTK